MIQANELRIGNWVNIIEAPSPYIEELGLMECVGYTLYLLSTEEDVKAEGIPLTEEWLMKLGFKNIEKGYSIGISDYGYVIEYLDWREDWTFGIEYYDPVNVDELGEVYNFNGLGLKYVHQLQNLYFSLIGTELTIK